MYTILVRSDDSIVSTNREPIYHRSSLVRKLRFLVDPEYQDGNDILDMRSYVCTLEYKTPISDTYVPVILTPSTDLYKDKLEYILSVDTNITSEVGNLEMKLSWMQLEMDLDGTFKERVRKTPVITIEILPVAQWSDYIASSNLDNIAGMILQNQAMLNQTKDYMTQLEALAKMNLVTKADNIKIDKEENTLQLQAMGRPIGDKVTLEDCECENGVPIVDFSNIIPEEEEKNEIDNVVEFGIVEPEFNEFNNVVNF